MDAVARRTRLSRGFTLVEMLTVIVIIGILASLITAAAIRARAYVREAAIKTEIHQLEMALQQYKNAVGEYPPDFFGVNDGNPSTDTQLEKDARNRVLRHLRRVFPRYTPVGDPARANDPTYTPWEKFVYDVQNVVYDGNGRITSGYGIDPRKFTPASALAFWLGGLPQQVSDALPDPSQPIPTGGSAVELTRWAPAGFHTDPRAPFHNGQPRTKPYYEFKPEQFGKVDVINDLMNGSAKNFPVYYARGLEAVAPYVYFKAVRSPVSMRYEYGWDDDPANPSTSNFSPYTYPFPGPALGSGTDFCVPYLEWRTTSNPATDPMDSSRTESARMARTYIRPWRNPEAFQIICPGLDGLFGNGGVDGTGSATAFRVSRSGGGFSVDDGDHDNIANFSDGRLESEIE